MTLENIFENILQSSYFFEGEKKNSSAVAVVQIGENFTSNKTPP